MKKIYHLSTCDTCKRILKELQPGEGVELREIKSQPLSEQEVDEMKGLAGSYEALFSRRARKFRGLGLHEMELTEDDYRKYLLTDYTFLKRPVVIVDGNIFIGNAKKVVEAAKEALG